MNKDKIAQQAKKIMDDFMSALDKVHNDVDFQVRREHNIRELQQDSDEGFAERMLANAPQVKDNCIIAEKKKW